MPTAAIRADLNGLDLAKLASLKKKWGASMAALVRKGRDLGGITEHDYKRLNIELSAASYRTKDERHRHPRGRRPRRRVAGRAAHPAARHAETTKASDLFSQVRGLVSGCPRGDLNPHALSGTSTSS
jgi:Zn-dependent peptidase ImmA (M78 family)